jgi:hypothetical protein
LLVHDLAQSRHLSTLQNTMSDIHHTTQTTTAMLRMPERACSELGMPEKRAACDDMKRMQQTRVTQMPLQAWYRHPASFVLAFASINVQRDRSLRRGVLAAALNVPTTRRLRGRGCPEVVSRP